MGLWSPIIGRREQSDEHRERGSDHHSELHPADPVTQGGTPGITYQGGGSTGLLTQSQGLSLSTFLGIFVDLFAVLAVLSVVGIFVIIVVANRADPDPSGRRPQSVFYFAVSFVTLATTVLGSAVVVAGVVVLVGNHSHSVSNPAARAILFGGLITIISAVLLTLHLRRGLSLSTPTADTRAPLSASAKATCPRWPSCPSSRFSSSGSSPST